MTVAPKYSSLAIGRAGQAIPLAKSMNVRLSAISREGTVVEINYYSASPEEIPEFLDWMSRNGVIDYSMDGPMVTFAHTEDADLFWLTFMNRSPNRIMGKHWNGTRSWTETHELVKALPRDRPILMVTSPPATVGEFNIGAFFTQNHP
jgi:hypothetical protein